MIEAIEYTNPVLLTKLVQGINRNLKQNCDWLQLAYPVCKTIFVRRDETDYRFPGVYQNDGTNYQISIAPDDSVRSFSFFEAVDSFEIDSLGDPFDIVGNTSFPVALIVWLNLPKIYPGRSHDFTEELILDVLQNGGMKDVAGITNIENVQIETRTEEVFVKYDFDQTDRQFMIYPYSAFKINMTLIADISLCQ